MVRQVLIQTLVRIVLGVSLFLLFIYVGIYTDANITQPSTKSHWHLIEGPAYGQTMPSPIAGWSADSGN